MSGATKFAAVILLPILAWTVRARRPSQQAGEGRMREYPIECVSCNSFEVDIAPAATEVAMAGPPAIPGAGQYLVSTYDYRHLKKPMLTVSVRQGKIQWDARRLPMAPLESFLRYSPDGRLLLTDDGAGGVHLLELGSSQPGELRTIDLGLSAERPNFQPVDMEWSPDSKRVAVLFSYVIFHQGVVRVYDISSGQLQWERSFDGVEMAHEAWSPDGRRLAVTLLTGEKNTAYPPRPYPNLLVLDGDSGRTLLAVRTGDLAGPVCFAPDNAVLTAPLHFHPEGHDRWDREKVKVWDAATGTLLRQIASPGRNIHDHLELSQDGKVLLAYDGKEKSGFSVHALEIVFEVLDRRFELIDYKTGRVIATSPDLSKDECRNTLQVASFRLSPHGDRVLVYWPNSVCPPSVFEMSGADR